MVQEVKAMTVLFGDWSIRFDKMMDVEKICDTLPFILCDVTDAD